MPIDLDIVNAIAALYNPQIGDFDAFVQVDPMAPYVGIKYYDGYDAVVCRGSRTIEDWDRDAASEVGHIVKGYEVFGLLPYGFSQLLPQTYAAVLPKLRAGALTVFGGHSLGAPEAIYLAGCHLLTKRPVAHISLFECPNPGTHTLAAFFAAQSVSSWVNTGDPVPGLPVPIMPFLPWCPLIDPIVFSSGPFSSIADPFARHHIQWCVEAVKAASVT